MRNFYSVLSVEPKASDAEIKSAFRNLAKAYHPDVKPGDSEAEAAFQEAKRAYTFLSNPETRKFYDAFLESRRAVARRRLRRAAATMSASCIITSATVFLAMIWVQGGPSLAGLRELVGAPARASVVVRVPTSPASRERRTGDHGNAERTMK